MKRLFVIFCAVIICLSGFAQQQKTAKVTLKNGTILSGYVSELNPVSHITLVIAGFESKINMSDVASIEDTTILEGNSGIGSQGDNAPVIVNDYEGLPETYNLMVGPYVVEMRLVKGATFSMGYDGKGSRQMNSEPVHEVTLSSFYVNSRPLNKDIVSYLKSGKEEHRDKDSIYRPLGRKDSKEVADLIAEKTRIPVDLITEAQWEYVATILDGIFQNKQTELNHCRDYYGDYKSTMTPLVDPTGPKDGSCFVIREMSSAENVAYCRFSTKDHGLAFYSAIRITFPAKALKE